MKVPKDAYERLVEEQLYETVVQELQQGIKREGLWAKALVLSDGEDNKAKAQYIKLRIQSLIDEVQISKAEAELRSREEAILAEAERLKREKQEREAKVYQSTEEKKRNLEEMKAQQRLIKEKYQDSIENLTETESIEILKQHGSEVIKKSWGWLIKEQMGGSKKCRTLVDLNKSASFCQLCEDERSLLFKSL